MTRSIGGAWCALALGLTLGAPAAAETEITFYRVFGACEAEWGTNTDIDAALGECGILQTLANKFNAENEDGITVVTQSVDWGQYYDLLSATYASQSAPDVAFVHRSVLPNFAARRLFEPIGDDLAAAGVDLDDYLPEARDAVTYEGEVIAMPWDIHTLLYHMNVGLLAEAGLVDDAGEPVLPTSPEEFLDHARRVKEATGKPYVAMGVGSAQVMPVRLFHTFMAQQGVDAIPAEGGEATIDTPEGRRALEVIAALYEEGLADPGIDYSGSEQAFINGEAAVLINGTWVVDAYTAQAELEETELDDYAVASFPTLFDQGGVWADSSLWAIPRDPSRPEEEREAAIAFLAFLDEMNEHWARTGHLPVQRSVLEGEGYAALPQRVAYRDTPEIATSLPMIENQRAIQDEMAAEFNAVWLADKPIDEALAAAQERVDRILSR